MLDNHKYCGEQKLSGKKYPKVYCQRCMWVQFKQRKALQAEGTANEKALRHKLAWTIPGIAKRLVC